MNAMYLEKARERMPNIPLLIKHRPSHLAKCPILPLNNTILRGNIW